MFAKPGRRLGSPIRHCSIIDRARARTARDKQHLRSVTRRAVRALAAVAARGVAARGAWATGVSGLVGSTHPRRAVRPGGGGAAARVRRGAEGGLRRARRDGHLVAHPARPRQPRARSAVPGGGRRSDPLHGGLDRARAGQRRGALLRRRRLRLARPVARPARGEAGGRARRQAHQAGPRTGDCARPGSRRRVFRDRALSVLRRRRAGRREDAAVPPDAPRRQQDRGHGAHEAGARAREAPAGRSGLPAADSLSLVRAPIGSRRRAAGGAPGSLSRQPDLPRAAGRRAGSLPARSHRQPGDVARAARRCDGRPRQRARRRGGTGASGDRARAGRPVRDGRRARPAAGDDRPSGRRGATQYSRSGKGRTGAGTTTRRSRPTSWR